MPYYRCPFIDIWGYKINYSDIQLYFAIVSVFYV